MFECRFNFLTNLRLQQIFRECVNKCKIIVLIILMHVLVGPNMHKFLHETVKLRLLAIF